MPVGELKIIVGQRPKNVRLLGMDLGTKTIGLALSDTGQKIATPFKTIQRTKFTRDIEELRPIIRDYEIGGYVLGLPLNMDGSEGDAAKSVRGLKGFLEQRFGIPVHLMDERLSSADADDKMSRSGLTRGQKKSRRDALAAAAILRDFLDQKKRGQSV